MRISIRLHPCSSETDLGLPRKMHAGESEHGRLISRLFSRKQAARESSWFFDAITSKRKLGISIGLGSDLEEMVYEIITFRRIDVLPWVKQGKEEKVWYLERNSATFCIGKTLGTFHPKMDS
ncbi:hypothetical protein CEXT_100661 [Caerostris extrusa]|uniref:Uncharacterized protein n=1 Tax=Caerostris extrusa TaxID=172846 RepID=A0AAV4W8R5_CAEEX|nr:hypothetical protein CEXT_100661 [Caerostris extrusa]